MILFFAQRFVTYMAVLVLGKIGPIFVMGSLGIVYFVSIVYKYKENKKSGFLIFFSILLLIMALSFFINFENTGSEILDIRFANELANSTD